MPLHFQLLGAFQVHDGRAPLALGGEKQRRLLAQLALRAGEPVPVPTLLGSVWDDDPPASAAGTVQAYVSRLRALLAGHADVRLVSVGGSYQLCIDPDAVDALRFTRLVETGLQHLREARYDQASRLLTDALGLWHGPFLCGNGTGGDLLEAGRRLSAVRESALDARHDAELALGHHAELLPELRERVAARPLREAPYRQLMLALESTGQQAEALAVYAQVRQVLVEELGVEPGQELRRLHERLLAEPVEGARTSGTNLPPAGHALVGRESELAALAVLLEDCRLVTVTGAGGSGKTRLSLETARTFPPPPDGTWLIELAGTEDARAVDQAVARTLRVLEQPGRALSETIAESLARRELLLVLDNCEHVAEACARLVTAVLQAAPGVRVLATSREPLNVEGETVFRLLPLAVPPDQLGAGPLAEVASVQLFVERARAADAGFALGEHNAAAVARVCRDLDGLPLALELAAATLHAVDVGELAARLPDRFAILTRGPRTAAARHRSLQAAVDWGYALLDPLERDVYQQLSAFAGGFTLESAERVCVVRTGAVLPVLAALVDKSFVTLEPGSERYRLLETLRLHAAGELAATGREQEVARRHALQVLELTGRAAAELRGRDQLTWVDRLDEERDDIAAALRWSIDSGAAEVALGLVSTLWWYWWRNGHIPDGARWARQVLDRFAGPADLRAAALVGTAHLTWKLGEFDECERLCDEALQLVAVHELPGPLAAAARGVLAMVSRDRGDLDRARGLLHDVLAEYVETGEQWGEAATLNMIVSVERDSSDHDHALDLLERSARLFRDLGDLWGVAWSAWLTGRVETRRGHHDRAARQLRHSIVLASELRHGFGVVLGMAGVAGVSAARGDHVAAARLLGATDALEHAMGFPVRAIEREDSSHDVAVTRAALGPQAYQEHWLAGARLTPEAALGEALSG